MLNTRLKLLLLLTQASRCSLAATRYRTEDAMRASAPDAALPVRQYQNFALSLTELRQRAFRLLLLAQPLLKVRSAHPAAAVPVPPDDAGSRRPVTARARHVPS